MNPLDREIWWLFSQMIGTNAHIADTEFRLSRAADVTVQQSIASALEQYAISVQTHCKAIFDTYSAEQIADRIADIRDEMRAKHIELQALAASAKTDVRGLPAMQTKMDDIKALTERQKAVART